MRYVDVVCLILVEWSLIDIHAGHILTRIVCKGAYALGVLKEYYQELKVLQALLAQTRWRRGRRGRWYERRALVLMTHLKHEEGRQEEAMWVVIDALKDPDTHIGTCRSTVAFQAASGRELTCRTIVFRPMLERRLTRLEKSLNIPLEERHVCEGSLQAPVKVFVDGVRIYHRAGSLLLDQAGRVVNQSPVKRQGLSWANRRDPSSVKVKQEVGVALHSSSQNVDGAVLASRGSLRRQVGSQCGRDVTATRSRWRSLRCSGTKTSMGVKGQCSFCDFMDKCV